MPRTIWIIFVLFLLTDTQLSAAGLPKTSKPGPGDKCPVCGMFVARYADFLTTIVFRDNSAVFFDGPKDFFKFYNDPARYLPSRSAQDITTIFVTDYYSLAAIDGRTAWFVIGSDVRGPMGHDLVPFSSEGAAQEFMKDHRARRIVRFREATIDLLKELE